MRFAPLRCFPRRVAALPVAGLLLLSPGAISSPAPQDQRRETTEDSGEDEDERPRLVRRPRSAEPEQAASGDESGGSNDEGSEDEPLVRRPRRRGGRILKPSRTTSSSAPAPPMPKEGAQPTPAGATIPSQKGTTQASRGAGPSGQREGILYWTGRLRKNERIVIEAGSANTGFVDGDLLPGAPVEVVMRSPVVKVVEEPGPDNGWRRVVFVSERGSKDSVTVTVEWRRR